ncbi:MAG TPA: hypothetical protein VKX25_05125 [Bryobacteraceae bacterium]|jgi:hypothetical protein|nr:hypothetical protein [Bryobacteraceae bacterium]
MSIRTTVTLDEDVLERVKQESMQRGEPFKKTLNDLLRLAVSLSSAEKPKEPFRIRPFENTGPAPGINFDKTGELLDLLEGPWRR